MEIFCLNSSLYLEIFEIFGGPEIASTLTCKLSSYVARLTILPPLKCFSLTGLSLLAPSGEESLQCCFGRISSSSPC